MKRKLVAMLALCLVAAVLSGCLESQKSDPYGLAGKTHSAVTPVDRKDDWWAKSETSRIDQTRNLNLLS